jgi:hypothetical protein
VRYLHVEQSLSLDLAFCSQVVLHELLDIDVVLNLVEDSFFLKLKTDDGEVLLFDLRW